MNTPYLQKQIITYMGNKRKLLPAINNILHEIKQQLGYSQLVSADAFSGSGIVSRLLKTTSNKLYVNDNAGYSKTLNECFLSTLTTKEKQNLSKIIDKANDFAHNNKHTKVNSYISKYWSPKDEKINIHDRVYFTHYNGKLLDRYMHFINHDDYPKKYRPFLLAQILVKASIHNNTNGQFSAFYKNKSGVGKYGGEKEIDIKRITKEIMLDNPILSDHPCDVHIEQMDANKWVSTLHDIDVMYIDPPYNKHPYSIYYFLLDIINSWDTNIEIPNTNRGQPKTWKHSAYNSTTNAEKTFKDLILNIHAKFIIVSYNNNGIIPIDNLETILKLRGKVYTYPVKHKVYNRMKGIANYKRVHPESNKDIKEYLWLVDTR